LPSWTSRARSQSRCGWKIWRQSERSSSSAGTSIRVWLDNGTADIWDTGYSFDQTSGAWHHYALTWDGSTAILYVDGVNVASTSRSGPLASQESQDVYIGRDPNIVDRCLAATIDEVAIYNTALSAARIAAHFAAGS
jgi:Concanavalin A-like lectin/glucanases superfamily